MKLMKKSFSMLLAVAMVFTATFGCMTVSSFAADRETGSETESSEAVGPKLVNYALKVSNTEVKTEEGSTIKVILKFDKDVTLGENINDAFEILINNVKLPEKEVVQFNIESVVSDKSDSKNIIITLKGNGNFVKVISGTIDISLKTNYYNQITDADKNAVSEWTDIHTMVPTGLTFKKGEYVIGSKEDGRNEAITFNVTGSAVIRGKSPIQILLSDNIDEALDNKIIDEERSCVSIHTHNFKTDTNEIYAGKIASAFKSDKYTMTASGTAITLSANKASDTQTLKKYCYKNVRL